MTRFLFHYSHLNTTQSILMCNVTLPTAKINSIETDMCTHVELTYRMYKLRLMTCLCNLRAVCMSSFSNVCLSACVSTN